MKPDYYRTLGVPRTAGAAVIKKAYRGLAFKYHPDRNQGDALAEEQFKLVTEAYETIGNPGKRIAYDASLRRQAVESKRRETTPPPKDGFYMPHDEVLRDFYEGFYFRQDTARHRGQKGHSLRVKIDS